MRIISFLEFIIESEVAEETMTKKQLKRLKYFVVKQAEIVKFEDLDKYNIPDTIKAMMKDWDVIQKSPYSDSFYSSEDIFWGSKPEGSYRVSDHWNFTSNRDGKSTKHCRTTTPTPNNSHISIGKYSEGSYTILLSEPTKQNVEKKVRNVERLKYLTDPETLHNKKVFKDKVLNGEIYGEVETKDGTYSGRIMKYTGAELKITNKEDKMIYNNNSITKNPVLSVKLFDKDGNKMEDLFKK